MSSVVRCSVFLVIQLLRCVRALNGPPTLKKKCQELCYICSNYKLFFVTIIQLTICIIEHWHYAQ